MKSLHHAPLLRSLSLALLLVSSANLRAASITANEEAKAKPKTNTVNLQPRVLPDDKKPKGTAITTFAFHPERKVTNTFTKDFVLETVQPNPFTHTYPGTETHKTTGTARYNLKLQKAENGFVLSGTLTGTIRPGVSKPPMPVSISATASDPMTFSDVNSDAHFFVPEGGLEYSFSLASGTAFPVFSQDLAPGGTGMLFQARIAPGLIAEPGAFWDSPSGLIDLFTLSLVSDAAHNITAELSFGAGNSNFTLDFRTQSDVIFDPNDAVAVDLIEAAIAGAFSPDGQMHANFNDIFKIGIAPSSSLTAFTLGRQTTITMAGIEIPERGSTFYLFAASLLALFTVRRCFRF
jgi:hypothetical protein